MATPLLTATPGAPVTYNPSMADTFSWVPVQGAGRPLYARAVYPIGGSFDDPLATIITLLRTLTAQGGV